MVLEIRQPRHIDRLTVMVGRNIFSYPHSATNSLQMNSSSSLTHAIGDGDVVSMEKMSLKATNKEMGRIIVRPPREVGDCENVREDSKNCMG